VIILIDTDILIDVALDREPFAESAAALLDRLEQDPGMGYVAWHSISNFYYMVAPEHGKTNARKLVLELTAFIEVAPASTAHIRRAIELPLKDFEDSMQVAAALACDAQMIATRNVKDYLRSPVRAVSPEQALKAIGVA
jgi:predicted nucleic acid-binding protein